MIFFFVCGGTGGHIFPALATSEEIKKRNPHAKIWFVSGKNEIENRIFSSVMSEPCLSVECAPFRGARSFVDHRFLLKLIKGYFQSRKLLTEYKPDLVVGFGGYVSFPMLVAAKTLGMKTLLHEQNVVPGRANRMLSKLTDRMALSADESRSFFSSVSDLRVTGNPVRVSIESGSRSDAISFFGFDSNKKTLLILGGSQGAESINRVFLDALGLMPDALKERMQVLHLCGKMDPESSESAGRQAGLSIRAFSFFDRMDYAYAAADACVGRAGATFLAEIDFKQIPALLVPYPYGDGHQRHNARVYCQHHEAVVVEQKELTPIRFVEVVTDLLGRSRSGMPTPGVSAARQKLAEFLEESVRS